MSLGRRFLVTATQGLLGVLLLWHSAVDAASANAAVTTVMHPGSTAAEGEVYDLGGPSQGTLGSIDQQQEQKNADFAEAFGDYYLTTKERKAARSSRLKRSFSALATIALCVLLLEVLFRVYLKPTTAAAQKSYTRAHPGRDPLDKFTSVGAALLASPLVTAFFMFIFLTLMGTTIKLAYLIALGDFKASNVEDSESK